MEISKFYQAYLDIKNPFPHQIQFWDLALKGKFPILIKAPTGSGKTEKKIWKYANKIPPQGIIGFKKAKSD